MKGIERTVAQPALLSARGVTRRFGEILANDGIDFDVRPGEVHALLGENGAGKSTLMNILCGRCRPDRGELVFRGRPVAMASGRDARRLGIQMVHQHFMLVPAFTVAENVVLGCEPARAGRLDLGAARERIRAMARDYGLEVDPDAPVEALPVGARQWVELLKALYREVRVLILDEPTAVLAPPETERLFAVLRTLVRRQVACVFITHKLSEAMTVADRVSVMRRGRMIASTVPSATSEAELAEMMIGRSVAVPPARREREPGRTVLEARRITVSDDRGGAAVSDLSLRLRSGEILGIAGVQGNGQRELVEALAGLRRPDAGQILLEGRRMAPLQPRSRIRAGMAHIPEDRQTHGLVLSYSVADNQVLSTYYRRPFARWMIRRPGAVRVHSLRLIEGFDIRGAAPDTPAGELSGGNQQKVVASRELSRPVSCLLANQPTRGLDVGAAADMHRRIASLCAQGAAVLLVSSEIEEILELADRIAVMYRGRLAAEAPAADMDRRRLGMLMASGRDLTKD